MNYCLPEIVLNKYSDSLFVYRLYFTDKRWLFFYDFDHFTNNRKYSDLKYLAIELTELISGLGVISEQYNKAKMELPPLEVVVLTKKDAKVVDRVPLLIQ